MSENKHQYYEMIAAKAANMDLTIYGKLQPNSDSSWSEVGFSELTGVHFHDYFLCLPQHKEAVFHSLNGGEIGCYDDGCWLEAYTLNGRDGKWKTTAWYMNETEEIIIKPRKEKRWIGYCANTNQTFPHPQVSMDVAEDYAARNYGYKMEAWQFIEIEVEVQS